MGRLFGTDGARGIANKELTCELAMDIGRAAAMILANITHKKARILIGKDTRISSNMLESALAAGLCSVGADAVLVGFVPTPATALLVKELGCDAGFMISASHNPCEYNGIKIFDREGYKLPDEVEEEIESIVLDKSQRVPTPIKGEIGSIEHREDAIDIYIDHIASTIDVDLSGMEVALDCANGSASSTAQKLFERLGANCHMINHEPDGININENCGSTHLEYLQNYIKNIKVDLGLAFDGDADRCLAVDENGEVIDGDKMIAIAAKDLKDRGELKNNTVVMTIMSNFGFFKFAKENGIHAEKTKVGDRYVLENMRDNSHIIGGEQSGHIIYSKYATTGDGQLSGIQLMAIMKRTEKPLSELAQVMTHTPQVLLNLETTNEVKLKYMLTPSVIETIKYYETVLGDTGRILVRNSGTEPLIRIMVEGEDKEQLNEIANAIAESIKEIA